MCVYILYGGVFRFDQERKPMPMLFVYIVVSWFDAILCKKKKI